MTTPYEVLAAASVRLISSVRYASMTSPTYLDYAATAAIRREPRSPLRRIAYARFRNRPTGVRADA